MRNQVRTWAWTSGAVAALCALASAQFTETFENAAFIPGSPFTVGNAQNATGWYQWDNVANSQTLVFNGTQTGAPPAHGGSKYIGTQLASDTIHRWLGTYTSGHWDVRMWTYVAGGSSPRPMLDSQWLIYLNDYNDLGPYQWATQINFDPALLTVAADNGYSLISGAPQWGISTGLVTDAWKEVVIDVDVTADVAQIYYDGVALGDPFSWAAGPFGGNVGVSAEIECIDLYANSTTIANSFMYWDDFSIQTHGTPPTTYCTSGTTSGGCIPSLTASAQPSVAGTPGCLLTCTQLEPNKNGLMFYGLSELNPAVPWASGSTSFLCVKSPTQRTTFYGSGGTTGCTGQLQIDFSAWLVANPVNLGSPHTAGQNLYCQEWYRDPGTAKTTGLSNAVKLTFVP